MDTMNEVIEMLVVVKSKQNTSISHIATWLNRKISIYVKRICTQRINRTA